MDTTLIAHEGTVADDKADWYLVFEAALRVGNFSSLDSLIQDALEAWLAQLAPELRWKIAIELYTNEHISTGKAAEISGLNYVVFMEKLRAHDIPFMAAEPASQEQKEREEALIHAGFNLPNT